MRSLVRAAVALSLLTASAQVALARCGDDPGDAQAVADARAQVDTDCNCAGAPNHGTYVSCAAGVAQQRADNNLLRQQCKSAVKKCAARSTCGKPGFVTCCVPKNGETKCKIKRDAAHCTDAGGCVGNHTSCCDACTPTGCASPSGAFLAESPTALF